MFTYVIKNKIYITESMYFLYRIFHIFYILLMYNYNIEGFILYLSRYFANIIIYYYSVHYLLVIL